MKRIHQGKFPTCKGKWPQPDSKEASQSIQIYLGEEATVHTETWDRIEMTRRGRDPSRSGNGTIPPPAAEHD